MVKFTIEAVHAALSIISAIQGRPTQGSLRYIKMTLVAGLWKLKHVNYPNKGYGQYLVNLTVRVDLTKQESQQAQLKRYFLGCVS